MVRQFKFDLLRFALWLLLPIALTCGGFAQTGNERAGTTFHSEVTEVRVSFSATDQANRVVANVQASDFAIVDQDRVVRDFRSFTRSGYTRLDVAVLLDASGSAASTFHQALSNIFQWIGQAGSMPEESFSVLSFRELKPTVLCRGNCRSLEIGRQSTAATTGGLTPLYDSVVFASQMLGARNDVHTRKILILFSDGADTISLRSLHDAFESALENDVAIYTADVSESPHMSAGTLILRGLAVNTGGRYFAAESGTAKVLDAILADFHATYTVAYKLPSYAAGFHQVRILPTHNLSLQFHCRRGYHYPEN